MDNSTIICTNCGATCKTKDEYCKNCWKKIHIETEPNNSIIDGMHSSEWEQWEEFIDKNADRYIEIYKENHDKKFFAHINWSAFFFGLNWVLYRRMFKVAVIAFIVVSLLSTFLSAVFLLPYRDEMKSLMEDIEPYRAYIEHGGKTLLTDAQGVPYSPKIVQRGASAERKLYEIALKAQLKCLLLIPLFCVFWGFFGDAIYKMHIKEKIRSKKGGTSIPELLGGRIILNVIGSLFLEPITSLIIAILI
ncbi:MAG: DUF2628 domain-containing protein [Oscillospiraceae bacterium]|nr:DUF2628 domain-containing protein [Oscillospiraceae bacterium]